MLFSRPGILYLESAETKLDPGQIIAEMKSGKLTPLAWHSQCAQKGMIDWPLACATSPPTVA